jgi:enterochelin esterase-like enzyme
VVIYRHLGTIVASRPYIAFMRIILPVVLALSSLASLGLTQQPCKATVVGNLRIEQFQSTIFDRMITVRIWLPAEYTDVSQATRKYPTLYMLDGQNAFDQCTAFKGEPELRLDETVTRLIAERKIPPMIVVGVDSAHGEGRDYEYEVWKDPLTDANAKEPDGKELPLFFGTELIPYVSARYRVSDDAGHTGIGGTSVGGFAALYVALIRPDLFGLVLAESPDLWLGNGQILRDTTFLLRAPDRIAIGVGKSEYAFPQSREYFEPLRVTERDAEAATVKMDQILASNLKRAFIRRPAVKLVIEPGANHSSLYWSRRIPAAIKFLYGERRTGR